jgi:hypothetical protein
MRITIISILILFLGGCKTLDKSTPEKQDYFKGTIIYDVEVVLSKTDTSAKAKKSFFGSEMYLTIFKNGDIQRKYNGNLPEGYDLYYVDLEENLVMEKYNNSDTLFTHKASTKNIIKLNSLREDNAKIKVMEYDLKDVSIGAQSLSAKGNSIAYLTIKYWYTEALKVDKTQYVNINDDLWNFFLRESNGSLFLKYEVDYFNYKVIYTAKEVKPNRYENYKEKVSTDSPRVGK